MNDDMMKRVIDQSRELQQKITDAMAKGHEHAQPYVETAMKHADQLRQTLIEQAKNSASATHDQTNHALDHLNEAMKSGAEAMKTHSANAQPYVDNFFKRAKEAADQLTKHFG